MTSVSGRVGALNMWPVMTIAKARMRGRGLTVPRR